MMLGLRHLPSKLAKGGARLPVCITGFKVPLCRSFSSGMDDFLDFERKLQEKQKQEQKQSPPPSDDERAKADAALLAKKPTQPIEPEPWVGLCYTLQHTLLTLSPLVCCQECCGNGCPNCVWTQYWEQVRCFPDLATKLFLTLGCSQLSEWEEYEQALARRKASLDRKG